MSLTEIVFVSFRHPYLMPDGYTLVSVSSSRGIVAVSEFPSGDKGMI